MDTTTTTRHHCPTWCIVTSEQHDAELADWDGGALHWSTEHHVAGVRIVLAAATDASGAPEPGQERTVHLGTARLTLEEATAVLAALTAVVERA